MSAVAEFAERLRPHRRRALRVVVVLSCLLRIIYVAQSVEGPIPWQHHWDQSDMFHFDAWAQAIAQGDWLSEDVRLPIHGWHRIVANRYVGAYPEEVSDLASGDGPVVQLWDRWMGGGRFYQEPLYAYSVASTYAVAGPTVWAVFAWQLLAGVLSNSLILLLTWRLFGPLAGCVAGALATFYGPTLAFELVLVRETLVVLATVALALGLDVASERGTARACLLAGLGLGAAIQLKSIFLPVALIAAGLFALRARGLGRSPWQPPAWLLLGMLLALAPLVLRNEIVGAPPFSIYGAGGPVFILGGAYEAGAEAGSFRLQSMHEVLAKSQGTILASVFHSVASYPDAWSFLANVFDKIDATFYWYEEADNSSFYFTRLHAPVLRLTVVGFAFLAPLGLVGLALSVGRRRPGADYLYLMIAVNVAVLAVVMVRDRYRLPLVPALLPFAAFALVEIAEGVSEGRWKRVGPALTAVLLLALWTGRPLPDDKPLVRSGYFIVASSTYYLPQMKAARAQGRNDEELLILEASLRHTPEELQNLGAGQAAHTDAEVRIAGFYARVYRFYAEALEGAERREAARHAREWVRRLRRAARGGAQS